MEFSKENNVGKGCLVTNTVNELGENADPIVMVQLIKFASDIKHLFMNNLKQDSVKDVVTIEKEANYLMTSILGLSVASKIFDNKQLKDAVEIVFKNL